MAAEVAVTGTERGDRVLRERRIGLQTALLLSLFVALLSIEESAIQLGPEVSTIWVRQLHARGRARPVTLYTVTGLGLPEGGVRDGATPASAG